MNRRQFRLTGGVGAADCQFLSKFKMQETKTPSARLHSLPVGKDFLMTSQDDATTPDKPDEFNESAPVQPGTEIEPNTPAETPTAPVPSPAIPDAPADQGADARPSDTLQPDNEEQEDESAQAQTVADDAIRGIPDAQFRNQESEHGGTTNPAQITPDDEQDVVDHMEQMERSGRIDMDAYRGERNDDDEAEMLGEGGMEPGDLDEHGAPRGSDHQYSGVE